MIRCQKCGRPNTNAPCSKKVRLYQGIGYSFRLEVNTPNCMYCTAELYDKDIEKWIRIEANEKIRNNVVEEP